MDAGELQFRTAALGGFHKQDVLDYIEKASREHAVRLEELEKERDEALESGARLQEQLDQARQACGVQTEQARTLDSRLAEAESALEQLRAELAQERDDREQAQRQAEELRARLEKAEPAAAAYESVKDRTAGIELEAHHRAMEVEAAAQAQVRAARADLEQWIYQLQAGYERLRTDLDATVAHAAGELERVKGSLEGLTGEFDARDTDLQVLLETYRTSLGPKAPQPLSLEEE